MPRPPGLLPEWADKPFAVRFARVEGIRNGRLRSADLVTPFRGVRAVRSADPTFVERCQAYAARGIAGQFFSHRTAARLHGLPLPGDAHAEALDVTAVRPARAPRMRGVIGHHATPRSVRVIQVGGLAVPDAATTIRLLASHLPIDDLVVVIDAAINGPDPLCTLEVLRQDLESHRGDRGVAGLRDALELARVGAESPQETRLRLLLQRAGLPEPRLNMDIYDRRGRFIARGDLVYPAQRVVVEYDGEQHRTDRYQYVRDVGRLEDLGEEEWRVIRVLAADMRAPQRVVRRVSTALGLAPR